jgi:membrane protein DedA with SNARE-associated domain
MEGHKIMEAPATRSRRLTWRRAIYVAAGLVAVVALAFLLHRLAGDDGFSFIRSATGTWAYVAVFASVAGDAIFPLLPGETALNAAATLAAGGSLELALVVLAGALGAIVGDSLLYWIARLARRRLEPQVAKAERNEKVAVALGYMGSNAPVLIVVGRYVPGLRFVVNATMGIARYPYRRFLPWSVLGGALWSVYTCGLAYLIGTALENFPLASVVVSTTITALAVAILFIVLRRRTASAPGVRSV